MSVDSPVLPSFTTTDVQLKILENPSRRLLLTAANRFGKTVLGMSRVLHCARGNYPYSSIPLGDTYWVFCPSWLNFEEVHQDIFHKMCPADWLRDYDSRKRCATIWREAGGTATIQWWTYQQDPRKLTDAPPPHGCWMDDPISSRRAQALYCQALARLAKNGWIWLTLTPIPPVGWWGKLFEVAQAGTEGWGLHRGALATLDAYNSDDHFVGQSLVPHLTRDQIVDLAYTYRFDKASLAARIFGVVSLRPRRTTSGW